MLTARHVPYGGWLDSDFPDVFDTRWAEWTVVRAEAQCEPFAKIPTCSATTWTTR